MKTGWPFNLEKTWNCIFRLKYLEKTLDFFLEGSKNLEISFGIAMCGQTDLRGEKNQMNGPPLYIIVDFSLVFRQILILISQIIYYIKKTTH